MLTMFMTFIALIYILYIYIYIISYIIYIPSDPMLRLLCYKSAKLFLTTTTKTTININIVSLRGWRDERGSKLFRN